MSKYNNFQNVNKDHRDQKSHEEKDEKKWADLFEKEWIRQGLMLAHSTKKEEYKNAVDFAENFGKEIAKKFTTSQIRNFFGEVRRIEMKGIKDEKTAFLLLRPKLSYAVKRIDNEGAKKFKWVILKAHEVVMEAEDKPAEFAKRFKNFVDFLEAVLAYHKVYDEK